jgi:hypothetical protein
MNRHAPDLSASKNLHKPLKNQGFLLTKVTVLLTFVMNFSLGKKEKTAC